MVRNVSLFLKTVIVAIITTISLPLQAADNVIGQYIADNPFETMIKLGRMSEVNPIYTMPSGSAGSVYISSAITTGDAVLYPLGYSRSSAPGKHFVIVSKETSLVERAASFDLVITENVSPSTHNIAVYTDWNRDGVFENAQVTPTINSSEKNFRVSLTIPGNAELGKTRVRVRLDSSAPSSANASVSGGRTYDFVLYVMEATDRTDAFVSVAANNENYGTALIETTPNEFGRYELNSTVQVRAVVNAEVEDVVFTGWQVNGEIVSTERIYSFTVTGSTHLIAMFTAPEPVLSAPRASTAEAPVWFQIMNAQTDERATACLAYGTVDGTYQNELRIEKPATTDDRFLWRLEDAGNGKFNLINKATGTYLYSNGTNDVALGFSSTPASYAVYLHSGNIYTIAYGGNGSGKYLNAGVSGVGWRVSLYSGGLGTGSGWYFYEIPTGSSGSGEILNISVSVSNEAAGSATASTTEVEEGGVITLTATANDGYSFANWTVDGEVVSSANPYTTRVYYENEYVANFTEKSYCTHSGNMTHGGRKLNSFTISDGTNSVSVSGIQSSTTSPVYVDKTASVLTTAPGAGLRFSALNWSGEWMHGYVFIDYNNDREFNQTTNANGTTGGEAVSFSHYNGQNSLGSSTANNGGVNTNSMPAWTLPDNLARGDYRVRFKIDWNSLDPCGNPASDNQIANNGGCICDFTLRIDYPDGVEGIEMDTDAITAVLNNGKLSLNNLPADCNVSVVSLSGQKLGVFPASAPQAQFDLRYAERYVIVVLEFENGQSDIIKLSDTRF